MAYRAFLDENRHFGVEIECFGANRETLKLRLTEWGILSTVEDKYRNEDREVWTIGVDNTIQERNPIELISPRLRGMNGLSEVRRAVAAIYPRIYPFKLEINSSCSFHVHWDVADFTGRDVIDLLKLYAKYEPVIDLLVAPDRRGDQNNHCRSLIKGKDNDFDWIDRLATKPYPQAFEVAKEFERTQGLEGTTSSPSARHHKVNLVAILKYGTIEFRQHQGTLNFEEMQNWILLTGQMVNRAKTKINTQPGEANLGEFIRLLGLSYGQLKPSYWKSAYATEKGKRIVKEKDFRLLSEMREYYKEKYRENKKDVIFEQGR